MSSTAKSYYNLAKPGIVYGNLLTATAGYLFASHWHDPGLYIAMLIGLALVVACGCVVNNVIDRGIDSHMERTRKRATVTGKIPNKSALIYALILGLVGTLILGIFTNVLTMILALFGLAVYVVIYGIAKRKTVYSTLIGSLAGAIPPLVGYTAANNYIDLAGVVLFLILICWQITHFYAIAVYRKKDYQAAKIPVWSIVKGDWSAQLQAIGFICLFTLFALSLFVLGYCGYIYLAITLVLGLGWLWYSVMGVSHLSPTAWGQRTLRSSLIVILILSIALAIGPVVP